MLQIMLTRLDGIKSLQIKILMYCLGTDTAVIMRPIAKIIQANPETPITAWNYCMPPKDINASVYKKANLPNFEAYIANRELRLARHTVDIDLKKRYIEQLNHIKNIQLKIKYDRFTKRDSELEYGTPTSIIIRNYVTKLKSKGVHLREDETLWAIYSYGKLLDKHRKPMTNLSKNIQDELFEAMDKYVANL